MFRSISTAPYSTEDESVHSTMHHRVAEHLSGLTSRSTSISTPASAFKPFRPISTAPHSTEDESVHSNMHHRVAELLSGPTSRSTGISTPASAFKPFRSISTAPHSTEDESVHSTMHHQVAEHLSGPTSRSTGISTPAPAFKPEMVLELMPLSDHVYGIAESIHEGGWDRARHLLELLSRRVSTTGDAAERVGACFFEALAVRYASLSSGTGAIEYSPVLSEDPPIQEKFSTYVALNQATPFLRFAHLTATQALLEALTGNGEYLHIVDVGIAGYGAQWPSFLQSLATMRVEEGHSLKRIRITGIGTSMSSLETTGAYLRGFAATLRVPFEFVPLVVDLESLTPDMLDIKENEVVGVNCVMQLHTLLTRGPEMLTNFLSMMESVAPKVVTLVEAEADLNEPFFLERFRHAWTFYGTVFESLDATMPASSAERAQVEQDWYRAEIRNVLAFEGSKRCVRHQKFEVWQKYFQGNGFENVASSQWALSQAWYLLKIHHPADGYGIVEKDGSVVLRWRDQPLFAVSSWTMAETEELL